MEFNYNDQKQTIMGVHIKDRKAYFNIRDAMHYTVFEGWQPTQEDVKKGIHNYYHPNASEKEDFQKIFGEKL